MITYIAIGGEPGTGKTNIMQQILPQLGEGTDFQFDLIRGTKHQGGIFVLGIYNVDNAFLGTDRLSMIALRDGRKFATHLSTLPPQQKIVVLFEGDRLFQQNFFNHLRTLPNTSLMMFILTCSDEVLAQRREQRKEKGINQKEQFLKGRKTKYKNIIEESTYFPNLVKNDTPADSARIVESIMDSVMRHSART